MGLQALQPRVGLAPPTSRPRNGPFLGGISGQEIFARLWFWSGGKILCVSPMPAARPQGAKDQWPPPSIKQ